MKRVHRYFGYFVLLLSQTTVLTGIYMHFKDINEPALSWTLSICNFVFYFCVLAILEYRHQKFLAMEESFVKVQKNMTIHEFEEAVARGDQLVIVDEFVLDIGPFTKHHPGGQFVIKHNIGQDVSKFFHGGYSLEGNLGPAPAPGVKHSNYARVIVNDLIIAQLDRKVTVQSTCARVDVKFTSEVASHVHRHFMKTTGKGPVPNFKRFFPGLSMIGKHFTIKLISRRDEVKPCRHYTICNVMQQDVYDKLIS